MNPHSELSCDDDFQDLTPVFLGAPSAEPTPVAMVRTKRDPSRYLQFLEARQLAEKATQKYLENLIQSNPGTYEGWNLRLTLEARPKSKPGAFKVLLALIDLVLTPSGAAMTQTQCRAKVHTMYPDHAVFKDWTKTLPNWAIVHASKRIASSTPSISAIKVTSKTTLRDLHNSIRASLANANGQGQAFSAKVEICAESVTVNGKVFRLAKNICKGKEYTTLRVNVDALLTALRR